MLHSLPVRAVLSAGLVFNLVVGPTALTAQQTSNEVPPITIRATTRLVVVDVVVTDKSGQFSHRQSSPTRQHRFQRRQAFFRTTQKM
jgi:hypothetical protein